MRDNYRQILLSFFLLFMTVSSLKLINEDWFLLSITGILLFLFVYTKQRLDKIFVLIIFYWILVNFISFIVFNESISNLLFTFFGSLMRLTIAYLLLKLSGPKVFFYAEKVSFWVLLLGFPIFLGIELIGPFETMLKKFDFGVPANVAIDGGWNILIYARNPWHEFQFNGYAWEPGATSMIIIFSLIITIYRDGYRLDWRKITYLVMLIFTFSTAGYLALFLIIVFYFVNFGLKKYALVAVILIPAMIPLIIMVYNLEFMSGKINEYKRVSKENQKYGYENMTGERVTRYDYVFLSSKLVSKWPVGYGVSNSGLIKSRTGLPISGANGLFTFMVGWGIIGFLFIFNAFIRFFKLMGSASGFTSYYLLFLALMVVFFSNPVERSPLFMGIIFYPFIFQNYFNNKSLMIDKANSFKKLYADD